MTDELINAPGAPLGDDIGQQKRQEPTHASLSGLWHFLAAAVHQVRPYWKEMSVVVMASIPQVALETAQPMLLMVLIDAIVAHDNTRVWTAVLGLVGLIPIYITGNFLFEYMASRVGAAVSNDLRMAAFWRLQALSVAYHRGRSRGDLLSRFSSDLDAVERSIVTELPFALSEIHRHEEHPGCPSIACAELQPSRQRNPPAV